MKKQKNGTFAEMVEQFNSPNVLIVSPAPVEQPNQVQNQLNELFLQVQKLQEENELLRQKKPITIEERLERSRKLQEFIKYRSGFMNALSMLHSAEIKEPSTDIYLESATNAKLPKVFFQDETGANLFASTNQHVIHAVYLVIETKIKERITFFEEQIKALEV
jgi:hypothetical protein